MKHDIRSSAILLLLIALAFVVFWFVGRYAEGYFAGTQFTSRFPEKTLNYTADQLQALVLSDVGKGYAVPVLFPLDLMVMLALSASMGTALWYWLGPSMTVAVRIALLIPAIYLLSDFIEDCLLVWLLLGKHADAVPAVIGLLKTITAVKLGSIVATIGLTTIAFLIWLHPRLRSRSY